MKEYLEDKKITKRFVKLEIFMTTIAILTIIIWLLFLEINNDKTYIEVIISILLVVLIFFLISKIENKISKKYSELFKARNKYYVLNLNRVVDFNELVFILNSIKNKKMCLNQEDTMVFRIRYGLFKYNIYRINAMKCNDFVTEEYNAKLKTLKKEYESKFGSDHDIYSGKRGYGHYDYVNFMHKINFINSNELNDDLINFISKNCFCYLQHGKTSQTILIIGDKMYVPSVRTIVRPRELKTHMKTLNLVFKLFKIEA